MISGPITSNTVITILNKTASTATLLLEGPILKHWKGLPKSYKVILNDISTGTITNYTFPVTENRYESQIEELRTPMPCKNHNLSVLNNAVKENVIVNSLLPFTMYNVEISCCNR